MFDCQIHLHVGLSTKLGCLQPRTFFVINVKRARPTVVISVSWSNLMMLLLLLLLLLLQKSLFLSLKSIKSGLNLLEFRSQNLSLSLSSFSPCGKCPKIGLTAITYLPDRQLHLSNTWHNPRKYAHVLINLPNVSYKQAFNGVTLFVSIVIK